MKIKGLDGITPQVLEFELNRGGKFVVFYYTISVVILTFRRNSPIYFVRAGEGRVGKGLPFTLVSLVLGWWGIPWGPIYTIQSLATNFRGGKDVTSEVATSLPKGTPAAARSSGQ